MSSHNSKEYASLSEYPTQWSDWVWSEEHQCNCRYRQHSEGKYEYAYDTTGVYGMKHAPAVVPGSPVAFSIDSTTTQRREYSADISGESSYATAADTLAPSVAVNLSSYEQPLQSGPSAPARNNLNIRSSNGYTVHSRSEFGWGKVFKVLWSKPKGSSGGSQRTTWPIKEKKYGELIDTKSKKFVIINPMENHCLCLAIVSYGKQGTTKKGVHAEHHAIIHTDGAVEIPGENSSGMHFAPIRVLPSRRDHKLTEWSRLNYSKVYTVEYNIKLWFIGKIHNESKAQLIADYNTIHPTLQQPLQAPIMAMPLQRSVEHSRSITGSLCPSNSSYSNMPIISGTTLAYTATSPDCYDHQTGYSDAEIMSPSNVQNSPYESTNTQAHSVYYVEGNPNSTYYPAKTSASQYGTDEEWEVSSSMQSSKALNMDRSYRKIHDPPPQSSHSQDSVIATSPQNLVGHTREDAGYLDAYLPYPPPGSYLDSTVQHSASTSDYVSTKVNYKTISGSSSTDSLTSLVSATPSLASSATSLTPSTPDIPTEIEQLFNILFEDPELTSLYKDVVRKASYQKMENNLRRCLVQFSKHLKDEALSSKMGEAARFIMRSSKAVATMIREKLEDHSQVSLPQAQISDRTRRDQSSDSDDHEPFDTKPISSNLSEIKELILHSNSFQMLRENLRIFVHPNPIHKALFAIWPVTSPRTSRFNIDYNVEWEAQYFLTHYFPKDSSFGDVMTLTGGPINAQALSCRDYLLSTWPNIGGLLLDGLEIHLSNYETVQVENEHATISIKRGGESGNETRSTLLLDTQACYETQMALISALSWISSAMRYLPHSSISTSTTTIIPEPISNSKAMVYFKLEQPEVLVSPGLCWHVLFSHGVIAKGFPIRSRLEGRGLEINFADMALLAKCLSFAEYRDRLVVDGLESLLIPVAELQDSAIQWHYESKVSSSTGQVARTFELLDTNFLSQHDFSGSFDAHYLIGRRCFLGWSETVHIAMGTVEFSHTVVHESSADRCDTLKYVRSYGLSFGLQAPMARVGPSALINLTPTAIVASVKSSVCHPIRNRLTSKRVIDEGQEILFYDRDSETGWYIPQACVVLYMAQLYLQDHDYHLRNIDAQLRSLEYATSSSHGALEASRTLLDALEFNVCFGEGSQKEMMEAHEKISESSAKAYTAKCRTQVVEKFCDVVSRIWLQLDGIGGRLCELSGEFEKFGETPPKFLHGVDFIEVVTPKSEDRRVPIRHVEIGQPWACFAEFQPTVLFCKGLGHPIISRSGRLCKLWEKVPPHENFLVMTGRALSWFLKQQKNIVQKKMVWHHREVLIECHDSGTGGPINHTQQLDFQNSMWKSFIDNLIQFTPPSETGEKRSLSERVSDHKEGGFIFGKETCQPCTDHPPSIEIGNPLPSLLKETNCAAIDFHLNPVSQDVSDAISLRVPSPAQLLTAPAKLCCEKSIIAGSRPIRLLQSVSTFHSSSSSPLEATGTRLGPELQSPAHIYTDIYR